MPTNETMLYKEAWEIQPPLNSSTYHSLSNNCLIFS